MPLPSQPPSDETLLGFLLNALPDDEHRAIDALLKADVSLYQRMLDLMELFRPLEPINHEAFEPGGDLVNRTLALVDATPIPVEKPVEPVRGLSAVLESANRSVKFAWVDSLVLIAAGITILCILLPSVWYSREEARRFSCANHLRQLGESLHRFTDSSPTHSFPSIDVDGPFSFAGIYVVKLNDSGLIGSTNWLWCPSRTGGSFSMTIPSGAQFQSASIDVLDSWKRTVGGSYSYNLGNVSEGVYETPRASKANVPILGDTVMEPRVEDLDESLVHGRTITNILYSDGQVRSIRIPKASTSRFVDDPYLNRSLLNAAGEGHTDSCLGPSFQTPLANPLQLNRPAIGFLP
jgi:hypothetical protein